VSIVTTAKLDTTLAKKGFPCTNCVQFHHLNCVLHQKRKRFAPRASRDYVPIRQKECLSTIDPPSHSSSKESNSSHQLVEFVDKKDITRLPSNVG
jgi:hypothetical protein